MNDAPLNYRRRVITTLHSPRFTVSPPGILTDSLLDCRAARRPWPLTNQLQPRNLTRFISSVARGSLARPRRRLSRARHVCPEPRGHLTFRQHSSEETTAPRPLLFRQGRFRVSGLSWGVKVLLSDRVKKCSRLVMLKRIIKAHPP